MSTAAALQALRPGAVWVMRGDAIEWLDQQQTRPTDQEIAAWIANPPGTIAQVAAERERRLALGFNYDFGDTRGVHHIGTTAADMVGWGEVSTYVGALIDSGDVTTLIVIATNTGICQVTAPEWRAIEIAAAEFRQPLWSASFVLMAMSPIPAGYQNDSYWT